MTEPKVVHEWSNRRLLEQRNLPDYIRGYIKRWVEFSYGKTGREKWAADKSPDTLDELARLAEENKRLREALVSLLNHYVSLVNSGDCGYWDPETEAEIICARKLLGEN